MLLAFREAQPGSKVDMKRATPFVLLLFTLSGVSSLVYQIVWIRALSHLLGGTSYAISTVLAAFMGGLALGSRFYGDRADRCERPLALYAKLEFGIAALGGLVFLVVRALPPAYAAVAGDLPTPVLGFVRVLIAMALLLPPTFLMGGTLPVLSRFVVTRRDRLGRGLGLLYAVNTFGAVLGSFLAGFVLIGSLGLAGSTVLAVVLNLAIGAAVWIIDRGVSPLAADADYAEAMLADVGPATEEKKEKKAKKPRSIHKEEPELDWLPLALIFALSGFASLGYELYWTRALQHFLGNSTFAFSAMLTTFLLGLAGGGWLGGRAADRVASPARLLAWVQLGVGATGLATVLLLWGWLPGAKSIIWLNDRQLVWSAYLMRRFAVAFAVMALPTFLIGMTFPLVNRIGIRSLSKLGQGVGSLYFVNTLGAIAGSLAAGFLLLPLLGAKTALVVTALLSALLGLVLHMSRRHRGALEPWLVTALFIVMVVLSPRIIRGGAEFLADTQTAEDQLLFQQEDHAAETRVYRKGTGDLHMSVDGHHIGGTEVAILRKEKILAHLPMILRPDAKHTLSVGLGSGITLGTLALYDELETLSVVEIVPGVVKGARFFGKANARVMNDPRLDLHTGDGVQYLLTTKRRYDIISSDSKLNPEYAGNAPLLSTDYYRLCRDRLAEDGVMVQWLACHLPHEDIAVIARSFAQVFEHVGVYWYDPYNLIFAGSSSPLLFDADAARDFASREKILADLEPLQLDELHVASTLWVCDRNGLLANLGEGIVNSWRRPTIEFSMGRNFRAKGVPYHEDDNLRWLHRLRDPSTQRFTGELDAARQASFEESADKLLEGFAKGGGIERLETGLAVFEAGLAANPDDERLSNVLFLLRGSHDRMEEAMAAGQVTEPEALARVGLRRRDQGRLEEALDLFEQANEGRPDDPNILYNLLLTLRDLGRTERFALTLERFLGDFPRDARGHSLQGRILAAEGRLEAAVEAFRRAAELNAGSPITHNNWATALARMGRYEEAALRFERVCELQPSFNQAAYFAAASFSMAGRQEDAARWVRFCLDEGLARPEQFAQDGFFETLRASKYWDARKGELR
jgi:spermidine synthase